MYFSRRRAGLKSEQRSGTFTGTVFADPIVNADGVAISGVFFEPGSRTYWHAHGNGQVLTVEKGRGVVSDRAGDAHLIEAADVIYTSPGEEHWHGATAGSFMLHTSVAMGETTWLEEVDENTYRAANERAEQA